MKEFFHHTKSVFGKVGVFLRDHSSRKTVAGRLKPAGVLVRTFIQFHNTNRAGFIELVNKTGSQREYCPIILHMLPVNVSVVTSGEDECVYVTTNNEVRFGIRQFWRYGLWSRRRL